MGFQPGNQSILRSKFATKAASQRAALKIYFVLHFSLSVLRQRLNKEQSVQVSDTTKFN